MLLVAADISMMTTVTNCSASSSSTDPVGHGHHQSRALKSCRRKRTEDIDDDFQKKLHALLKTLSPSARREVIAYKLTQAQRLDLERWLLRGEKGAGKVEMPRSPDRAVAMKPEVMRSAARSCAAASRQMLHLGHGLFAQMATRGKEASQALAALKASVLSCGSVRSDFESSVRDAVRKELTADSGLEGLIKFRTRVSFFRDVKLSTPLRGELDAALLDWRVLVNSRSTVVSLRAGKVKAEAARLRRISAHLLAWHRLSKH